MMNYEVALDALLSLGETQKTTVINAPIANCVGRFLAQDVHAQLDAPAFSNSAMDGYALNMSEHTSRIYQVVGRIAAGQMAEDIQLHSGQAVRIFTGAPIPKGCNAVIAQEQTECDGATLTCTNTPNQGEHIRMQGEEFKQDELLMHEGTQLTPAHIGLVAGQGHAQVQIREPLRVVVLSTGNELTEPKVPREPLTSGAIYDANRYQLIAWLQLLHCEVVDGGILPDNLAQTQNVLNQHQNHCDLILTSGGASVGEEDHLKVAVHNLGELTQWKLAIKPGKPFAWGQVGHTPIVMLPGNPVAAFVTFKLLVEPLIRVRMGAGLENARPTRVCATAEFDIAPTGNRREFMRGLLRYDAQGGAQVQPLPNQGSHMLRTCAHANCLIDIAPDTSIRRGDVLEVLPL